MAKGSKIVTSDMISHFDRLNNIRVKFGMAKLPPYIPVLPILSSDMVKLDNALTSTAAGSPKISKNLSLGDISKGAKILAQTDINIKQMLTEWENTCNHYANNGDDGDCYSHNEHNNNDGDDSGVCHCVSNDDCFSVCDAL